MCRAHNELRGTLVRALRQRETQQMGGLRRHFDPVGLTVRKSSRWCRYVSPRRAAIGAFDAGGLRRFPDARTSRRSCCRRVSTAWTLAKLYLAGIGAELLSEGAPSLHGFSQNTTCYVSPQCFREDHRFADFIVHEAAQVFHNCKRSNLGLTETQSKVWLLDIEYRKRERLRIREKPMRAYSNWESPGRPTGPC